MNKKFIIIIGVFVFILLLGSGVYFLSYQKSKTTTDDSTSSQDQTIGNLSPNDIGLKLQMLNSNHQVKVIVDKAGDIAKMEYDITYNADIPASELAAGQTGGQVERGFNNDAKLPAGSTKYESKVFDLGSCSRNICRYDTGVKQLDIVMKVTKRDGKIYQVKDSINF